MDIISHKLNEIVDADIECNLDASVMRDRNGMIVLVDKLFRRWVFKNNIIKRRGGVGITSHWRVI